jgi:ATP-dependent DNA helicase RecQ/Werner syndrome ATP-dependent helicase
MIGDRDTQSLNNNVPLKRSFYATTEFNSDETTDPSNLRGLLTKFFGFNEFRPGQYDAITQVMRQSDVAIYFSTGSGKSLCYILPALVTGKITIVVSPLISLMADQCRGINNTAGAAIGADIACFLGSGQMDYTIEERAFRGDFLVVYLTPEKLLSSFDALSRLHRSRGIGLLAVDEAHCASQWGHDFRASYKEIGRFRLQSDLSRIPIMALTATAGRKVREEIHSILHLRQDCYVAANSVDRHNLRISVVRTIYCIISRLHCTEIAFF